MDDGNTNIGAITGNNSNWVNGTYKSLEEYFKTYSTPYDLLHKKFSYDCLLWTFGIPIILSWLYKISQWIGEGLNGTPDIIITAIYLYLTVVMMFVFRILFNYALYIFPKIEGPKHPNKGPWKHRGFLFALLLTLVGGLFA